MIALISDIHSNTEALEAVYEDMAAFPVEAVYCLGDVIGYGPQPREALDLVRRCKLLLLGNHEEGLMYCAEDFNERARRALEWTRDELSSSRYPREENHALWDFIDRFEEQRQEDGRLFVHASPRQPTREYVMPGDALDRSKMSGIFTHMEAAAAFAGHTHVPGVFVESGTFKHQSELPEKFELPGRKCLVNIGSVGQPRDGDNRASYVILDGDACMFRRVRYDIGSTMAKIRGNPELHDFLAARLKAGK